MLCGIVPTEGEVVDLNKMNDTLRASARRCFEAGYLHGVNEKGAMIRFDPEVKIEIFVQAQDQADQAQDQLSQDQDQLSQDKDTGQGIVSQDQDQDQAQGLA